MTAEINIFHWHFRSYYLLLLVLIPNAETAELRYGTTLEGFEFDARWPLGLRMCGRSCRHRGRCWSVNYYRSTLHCEYNEASEPGESAELIANSDAIHLAITSQDKECDTSVCSQDEVCVRFKSGTQKCITDDVTPCSTTRHLGAEASLNWTSLFIGYNDPDLNGSSAWSPSNLDQNIHQYIEYIFPSLRTFVGVTTSGLEGAKHFVTSYRVLYLDDDEWTAVTYTNGTDAIFEGNESDNVTVTNYFENPIRSTGFRLNPITWNNHICLRMDIIGC